jgi:hydrogenase maturation protease
VTRTLILGVGNTVRSDDGVGVHIASQIARAGTPDNVDVAHAGTSGLGMLDLIAGYDRLIVVDAIDCGRPPGTILELGLDDLGESTTLNAVNPHQSDLATILETGRRLGLEIPEEVRFVAVQIEDAYTFAETCTPRVAAAVDSACGVAIRLAVGQDR